MERRQFVGTLGSMIATCVAGCNEYDSGGSGTPADTPPTKGTGSGNDSKSFPDNARQLLLEENDFSEENWTLANRSSSEEGWYTHELERTDSENRLHVLYSDVWVYENSSSASDEYENRKSGYQERYETNEIDIGKSAVGWETRIAVVLFHEGANLGQIEYHVYDDGELTGATLNGARSYSERMYQDW